MKSYMDVVKNRYDNKKDIHIYDNIYSQINPVGFYINQRIRYLFYKIFNKLKKNGIDITKLKILDIGCGDGTWTRFFAELKGNTKDIYGMDLSKRRIEKAKTLNPDIKYSISDIVEIDFKNIKFDFITAIDVFSHLNTKEQIIKSLKNIHKLLTKDGLFLWYDIYNQNHFRNKSDSDTYGFNKKEIKNFCDISGFKCIYYLRVFKKIFWKYHTAYLAKKNINFWFIALLEKLLPGSTRNILFLFKKK